MSTKFFHAVRLPDDVHPVSWAIGARADLEPEWKRLAEVAVGTVERALENEDPDRLAEYLSYGQVTTVPRTKWSNPPRRLVAAHLVEYVNREVSAMLYPGRFDSSIDLLCAINLFRSPVYGVTFAKIFTDQPTLREQFMALPDVTNFEYWNNSDRPAEATKADWDFRRRVLDDAIGFGPMSQYSVTIRCDNYGMGRLTVDTAAAPPGEWLSNESIAETMRQRGDR